MDDKQAMRICELLIYCCDGLAVKEDVAELETLLDHHPEAIEYSIEVLKGLNYFHCMGQTPLSHPETIDGFGMDFKSELDPQEQLALLGDFAEYEKNAMRMEIIERPEKEKPERIQKIDFERPVRTVNKYSLATAILCAAAFFVMVAYVRLAPPKPYEVATIRDSIEAQWSSGLPLTAGTRLSSGSQAIRLTRGIVKLTTDDNVDVVLEAPTEFSFVSYSEISLSYGKLFARVSEQGYGFSVVTPNSKIVDLGTEFGVLSQIDGSTEVYMLKGKANLFAGEKSQTKTSQFLTAGSARKVDRWDSSVTEIPLDEMAVVRDINSTAKLVWKGQEAIRLADLLLGGGGFGTAARRTIEFDPLTGSMEENAVAGYRTGPGKITKVAESPYLDCLFVPGSGTSPTQISSAGHTFAECPATSGLYYSNIVCYKDWTFFDPLQRTFEQTRKQYADSEALYLHSNIGVTVDLQAVRRLVPGFRITDFRAFAGILRISDNVPDFSEADIWILVDGQLRSSRQGLRADQGYDIKGVLSDQDRFVTLAVTDSGKVYTEGSPANNFDTCGFAEPVFGLEPR
jgi:hypothetical protein